ncbi:MAG: hypothetical protein WD715_02125 [Dongiaceae bacterium]
MRILITMPHFFAPRDTTPVDRPRFGADKTPEKTRIAVVQHCLDSLYATSISGRYELDISTRLVGKKILRTTPRHRVDLVLCVRDPAHLIADLHLPPRTKVVGSRVEPRSLGFRCHKAMAERCDDYDLFGYLEDDLSITDPMFFDKIEWFNRSFGDDYALQPNRYERIAARGGIKVYVDGEIPDMARPVLPHQFNQTRVTANVLGRDIVFEGKTNPMAGCFFLTRAQLQRWMADPDFGKPIVSYFSPPECAQMLGPAKHFTIMKPIGDASDFLELRHLDPRLTRLKAPLAALKEAVPEGEQRVRVRLNREKAAAKKAKEA